jgi:hypothetical protein
MCKRLWQYVITNKSIRLNRSIDIRLNRSIDSDFDNTRWENGDAIRVSPYNKLTSLNQRYYIIPNDALLNKL